MTMANPLIKPTVINDWCLRQPSHSRHQRPTSHLIYISCYINGYGRP
jgi:hypothetical protein